MFRMDTRAIFICHVVGKSAASRSVTVRCGKDEGLRETPIDSSGFRVFCSAEKSPSKDVDHAGQRCGINGIAIDNATRCDGT